MNSGIHSLFSPVAAKGSLWKSLGATPRSKALMREGVRECGEGSEEGERTGERKGTEWK